MPGAIMESEPTTIVHATAIVHADGGTRYTTSRSHRRSGGVGPCTSTSCCRRHPRACTRGEQAASSRTSEAAHSRRVMLRDDLFLDSRDAAPAVVRSYEACEPEAQLRLRLRGTLNATLVHGYLRKTFSERLIKCETQFSKIFRLFSLVLVIF